MRFFAMFSPGRFLTGRYLNFIKAKKKLFFFYKKRGQCYPSSLTCGIEHFTSRQSQTTDRANKGGIWMFIDSHKNLHRIIRIQVLAMLMILSTTNIRSTKTHGYFLRVNSSRYVLGYLTDTTHVHEIKK